MDKVKDKITKLLALGESPNENEARAALLKAKELMLEYKLSEKDVRVFEQNVVKKTIGVTCTKTVNRWMVNLSAVIAENYCCVSFRSKRKNAKTVEIGFIGLEDDYHVCSSIYKYAVGFVLNECKNIKRTMKGLVDAKEIREMQNAYGIGFTIGVSEAFKKQEEINQEFGLVVQVPSEVRGIADGIGKAREFGTGDIGENLARMQCARKGYDDGQQFDPSTKIGE